MHISIRMTIHFFLYGCPSCTFLYEWLSIFFYMRFRNAHFCTNNYPFHCVWVFVMHICLRMTINIHMRFRQAHFCANDYPYSSWMGFRHAHFCTNDYPYSFLICFRHEQFFTNDCPFLCKWDFVMHISVSMTIDFIVNGFSSCTFLYEWQSIFISVFAMHISVRMTFNIIFEDVFVMHICVRMTIHFLVHGFSSFKFLYEWLSIFFWVLRHVHLCTNDYLFQISFQCVSVKWE